MQGPLALARRRPLLPLPKAAQQFASDQTRFPATLLPPKLPQSRLEHALATAQSAAQSPFERIGGHDVIRRITDRMSEAREPMALGMACG